LFVIDAEIKLVWQAQVPINLFWRCNYVKSIFSDYPGYGSIYPAVIHDSVGREILKNNGTLRYQFAILRAAWLIEFTEVD